MSETRLIRSGRGGATIHLRGCVRARGKTWPWDWAEGKDDRAWVVKAWLKPCGSCLPELASLQRQLKAQAKANEEARA